MSRRIAPLAVRHANQLLGMQVLRRALRIGMGVGYPVIHRGQTARVQVSEPGHLHRRRMAGEDRKPSRAVCPERSTRISIRSPESGRITAASPSLRCRASDRSAPAANPRSSRCRWNSNSQRHSNCRLSCCWSNGLHEKRDRVRAEVARKHSRCEGGVRRSGHFARPKMPSGGTSRRGRRCADVRCAISTGVRSARKFVANRMLAVDTRSAGSAALRALQPGQGIRQPPLPQAEHAEVEAASAGVFGRNVQRRA